MPAESARDHNLRSLRRLYDGLESGDVDGIRAVLAPTVVVRLTGTGALDGTYRGMQEAERLYRRVVAALGPGFRIPAHDVLVHDATLVVVPRGTTFGEAVRGMDVYHFEGGLISEIWLTAWRAPDAQDEPAGEANLPT